MQSVTVPLLEGPGAAGHIKPTTALLETDEQSSLGHFCLPRDSAAYFMPFSHRDLLAHNWKQYSIPSSMVGQEANNAEKNTNVAEVTNTGKDVDPMLPLANMGISLQILIMPIVTVVGSALIAAIISVIVTKVSNGQQVHLILYFITNQIHVCM